MLCDAMDGPLVALARKALETGEIDHVLPWVRPADEDGIRRAFSHALSAGRLDGRERELADRPFFEAVVRSHRAGEGVPYAGLKPSGADLGLIAPAAAQALETGMLKTLVGLLTDAVRSNLHQRHHAAMTLKPCSVEDVEAGRRYVEAYETYMRYVERLWQAAAGGDDGAPPHGGQSPPERRDSRAH